MLGRSLSAAPAASAPPGARPEALSAQPAATMRTTRPSASLCPGRVEMDDRLECMAAKAASRGEHALMESWAGILPNGLVMESARRLAARAELRQRLTGRWLPGRAGRPRGRS